MLGFKNIWGPKNIGPKHFRSIKMLDPKKCWTQKNFGSKKILGLK